MPLGSNSPTQHTVLRLEARKSFSFAVWIKDHHGKELDIRNSVIKLVVKGLPWDSVDDSDNLIVNNTAHIVSGLHGFARFNLQASDLDHKPGEYPYSIVLIDSGYSNVLVKGTLYIAPNTEFASVDETYDTIPDAPVTAMVLRLRNREVIELKAGSTLAPGAVSFLVEDQKKLDSIEFGAQRNVPANWLAEPGEPGYIMHKPKLGSAAYKDISDIVPAGGAPGTVLTKLSAANHHMAWVYVKGGGGGGAGIDATGIPHGLVPMSSGTDSWGWEPLPPSGVEAVNGKSGTVVLNMDDIADGSTRFALTTSERAKLNNLTLPIDWAAIDNKPSFGSMATADAGDYVEKLNGHAQDIAQGVLNNARVPRVSELRGFSYGYGPPTGGVEGDIYFQIG